VKHNNMTSALYQFQHLVDELLIPLSAGISDIDEKQADGITSLSEQYISHVKQLSQSAQENKLSSLQGVLQWILSNATHIFQVGSPTFNDSHHELLTQWPFFLSACLDDVELVGEFVSVLKNDLWPIPFDGETEEQIIRELIISRGSDREIPIFHNEVFQVIHSELIECIQILTENDSLLLSEQKKPFDQDPRFITYRETVDRLHSVFEMTDLVGVKKIVACLLANIEKMAKDPGSCTQTHVAMIEQWPLLLLQYLETPTNPDSANALLVLFQCDKLSQPLDATKAKQIANELVSPIDTLSQEPPRQAEASPDDISLVIPQDTPASLLDAFLHESPQHIAEISQCIQQLIRDSGNELYLRRLQNATHTLKGAAATVGIAGITNLCHNMEDIVEHFGDNNLSLETDTLNTLLETSDCLEAMTEYLQGVGDIPHNTLSILQTLLDLTNKIDQGNIITDKPDNKLEASLQEHPLHDLLPDSQDDNNNTSSQKIANSTPQENTPSLRVPTASIETLIKQVSENVALNGHMREQQTDTLNQARTLTEKSDLLQRKIFELESILDIKTIPLDASHTSLSPAAIGNPTISSGGPMASGFDPLELDQYSELHSHIRQFSETIADIREISAIVKDDLLNFKNLFEQQHTVNRDIQNGLMSTRMAKVKTIVPRLQRCVRNTCRLTDKTAELIIDGQDILMDIDVLSSIVDPLMHILRNSVDHGIEPSDQREHANKDPVGRIHLSFERQGNNIVIRCKDDGCGLDYEKIESVARIKGLLQDDATPTNEDIVQLLFTPGFSTKDSVSQTSGRGIGMDAVYQNIVNTGGNIDIQSELGVHLTLSINIPITLLSVNVVIISQDKQILAVPSNQIEQIVFSNAGKISSLGDKIVYQIAETHYPVFNLSQVLKGSTHLCDIKGLEEKPALLLRSLDHTHCVFIDKVIECRDVVIKSISKYLPDICGVNGVTIMAGGNVIPIMDLNLLLLQGATNSLIDIKTPTEKISTAQQKRKVLITEDSISVRRSLQELISDAGYDVKTAQDGIEAISIMEDWLPNILLSDLEMPVMNGLELAAYTRANRNTQFLPIIMITSRHTQKHQDQAKKAGVTHYLTKPYSETQLLQMLENVVSPHA
jgi:chemotaxis protein histidine kinase CheA/CheY-like chemotaxis protein